MPLLLAEWADFYVITGSAAAALTGLMFVVIALGADRNVGASAALKAFASPTIVYFSSVIVLAALLTMPHHSTVSLAACLLVTATAALGYTTTSIIHAARQNDYQPELEDWIWYAALPLAAYALLFIAGAVAARRPGVALYSVAATTLLLLLIGIHNAWDSAVFMASPRAEETHPTTSKDSASSAEDAPSNETYR